MKKEVREDKRVNPQGYLSGIQGLTKNDKRVGTIHLTINGHDTVCGAPINTPRVRIGGYEGCCKKCLSKYLKTYKKVMWGKDLLPIIDRPPNDELDVFVIKENDVQKIEFRQLQKGDIFYTEVRQTGELETYGDFETNNRYHGNDFNCFILYVEEAPKPYSFSTKLEINNWVIVCDLLQYSIANKKNRLKEIKKIMDA